MQGQIRGGGVLGVTKTPHSYLQMYSRSILKAWRIEKHESGNSFFFLGGGREVEALG